MKELQYWREVMAVLILSFIVQLFAISINDGFVFLFFHMAFPLGFIAAAMWKEGALG